MAMMQDAKCDFITQFYGYYLHESQIWLVIEYASVGSVNDLMRITNPHWLDEWEIATICRFTLHGLQYMHENRQIHRDIS